MKLHTALVAGNHTYRHALSAARGGHFIPNDDHPEIGIGQYVVVEFDPADKFARIADAAATAYDMVHLANDEWGNATMRAVATEWFSQHPACNFVMVYEHAGWWLAYARDETPCLPGVGLDAHGGRYHMEIVGTANDLAVMRKDRPQPTHYSGVCVRRENPAACILCGKTHFPYCGYSL